MMQAHRVISFAAIFPAVLFLSACTSTGLTYSPPEPLQSVSSEFIVDAGLAPLVEEPAHDWWRAFGDEDLVQLIETAFSENQDLRVAMASVRAARAAASLQRIARRPTGSLSAGADFGQPALAGGPVQVDVDPQTVLNMGGSAIWEIDLFGRIEALQTAAEADLDASLWTVRDVQALIAAEVARAWLDLRAANAALALTQDNVRVQQGSLELTQIRFEEGFSSELDTALALSQLQTTQATIPPLLAERTVALNRLATLTAQSVDALQVWVDADRALDVTNERSFATGALPLGDVGGLLRRRADLRASERSLAAAFARANAVRADYFPRITLNGDVSVVGTSISNLTGPNSFGFGFGPQLVWAGLDRARITAQLEQAEAETDLALARYQGAVLTALEETQSQFSIFGREIERYSILMKSAEDIARAVELSRIRYEEGEDDFLIVLDAEARQLVIDLERLQARQNSLSAAINVFQALGAGWQAEP